MSPWRWMVRLFGRRDRGAPGAPVTSPDEKRRVEAETAYWRERAEAARERALLRTGERD